MTTILIQLEGLPPSQNELRTKIRKKITIEKDYKDRVWCEVLASGILNRGVFPVGGKDQPLAVEVVYLLGTRKRRSDTFSNREKLLLDALKKAGILADDFWIKRGSVRSVNAAEDRTFVKIKTERPWDTDDVALWLLEE